MQPYLLRRALFLLISLAVILTLNFVLFRWMPGSAVDSMIDPNFTPEMKANLTERFGLDQPLGTQFVRYLRSVITLDFGLSFRTRLPVAEELLSRLPNTLALLGSAFVVTVGVGVSLGIHAARRRGTGTDLTLTAVSTLFNAMPSFLIALLLLLIFGSYWPIFPISNTMSIPPPEGAWLRLLDRIHHFVLPVASVVLSGFGSWFLYTRNHMTQALDADFVLLARAKGLPERQTVYRHAFRSMLGPLTTLVFLSLPGLLTGAVIVEEIFSLRGIGDYLVQATLQHDYPAIQAAFFLIAVVVLLSNFFADLVYALVDPRIRRE